MKNKFLLLGAAVLAVATLKVGAYNLAQSPRAAGNQIKLAAAGAAANQTFTSCKLIGSPKAIAEAGRNARMSCCGQTLANCSMVATCGK